MVIINNNSGLTEAHYSGTNLTEIYVGDHLVWPVNETPPTPIGDKLTYTISGNTNVIPCNETNIISYQEIMLDIRDKGGDMRDISGMTDAILGDCVGEINQLCFAECSALTSVTLSSNVKQIDESAFMDCISLPSIVLQNGMTKVSNFVFESCYELANVNIPNGVTEIGVNAYYDCLSLMNITIPSTVTKIGGDAFRVQEWTKEDQYQYNKMLNVAKNRVVICLPSTPPILGDGAFSIVTGKGDIATYTIYVPSNSLEAYKTAPNWSNISDRIMPMV